MISMDEAVAIIAETREMLRTLAQRTARVEARVDELEKTGMRDMRHRIQDLEQALRFYAESPNYDETIELYGYSNVQNDGGAIAREALHHGVGQ